MSIHLVNREFSSRSLLRKSSGSLNTDKPLTPPWTPPTSISGSPVIDIEGVAIYQELRNIDSAQGNLSIKLPSLAEFDQDIQALIQAKGPTEASTLPRILQDHSAEGSANPRRCPFSTIRSLYPGKRLCGKPDARRDRLGGSYYGCPPIKRKIRHINQKYTSKERDFVIARRERNIKWRCIEQEFAAQFGNTPQRTIQGLQALYYRKNQPIC